MAKSSSADKAVAGVEIFSGAGGVLGMASAAAQVGGAVAAGFVTAVGYRTRLLNMTEAIDKITTEFQKFYALALAEGIN